MLVSTVSVSAPWLKCSLNPPRFVSSFRGPLYYTTYKTFYKLVQASPEDPTVEKRDAVRALARFMSLHPHNLAQKTEIMVEHFRTKVRHKIGGKAKAMLVTSSRLHAKRY